MHNNLTYKTKVMFYEQPFHILHELDKCEHNNRKGTMDGMG